MTGALEGWSRQSLAVAARLFDLEHDSNGICHSAPRWRKFLTIHSRRNVEDVAGGYTFHSMK